MGEDRKLGGHSVKIEDRENICLTGVTDVLSFDEDGITADTDMGVLAIKGEGLHVTRLDLEQGILNIDGSVSALEYISGYGKNKGSMLSRIFK